MEILPLSGPKMINRYVSLRQPWRVFAPEFQFHGYKQVSVAALKFPLGSSALFIYPVVDAVHHAAIKPLAHDYFNPPGTVLSQVLVDG